MTMQRIAFVLAFLACAGHGRRVHTSGKRLRSNALAEGGELSTATKSWSEAEARTKANFDPLGAFAAFLLALVPETAFAPPAAGLRFSAGLPTLASLRPVVWNLFAKRASSTSMTKSVDDDVEGLAVKTEWESASMPTYDYRVDYYKDLMRGMSVVREQNSRILPLLEELRKQDFFSFFPFDLMATCSYMPTEEIPCDLDKCEVEPVEETPDNFASRDESEYNFALDGWTRKDMPSDFTEYYDLREQLERNTEYNGSRVWRFIHQRICFQDKLTELENGWRRDFNRAISGMHAAVSVQILSDNGFTEEGQAEYRRRVRDEPGCIANLYFAYMLSLCAIYACRERLDNCDYMGGGDVIRPIMQKITGDKLLSCEPVQRAAEKLRAHAVSPSAEEWKARLRCRDLYAIMNCVQCNLCRLHGKVMALGLGATLQVLLGTDGSGGDPLALDRVQIASLVATAAKFGSACAAVEKFRELDGDDMSKAFGAEEEKDKGATKKAEEEKDKGVTKKA